MSQWIEQVETTCRAVPTEVAFPNSSRRPATLSSFQPLQGAESREKSPPPNPSGKAAWLGRHRGQAPACRNSRLAESPKELSGAAGGTGDCLLLSLDSLSITPPPIPWSLGPQGTSFPFQRCWENLTPLAQTNSLVRSEGIMPNHTDFPHLGAST